MEPMMLRMAIQTETKKKSKTAKIKVKSHVKAGGKSFSVNTN